MTDSEHVHNEELLRTYRRRLQALELQAAQFGIYAPPHITIEIDDLKAKIGAAERKLGATQQIESSPEARQKLSPAELRQLTELMLALPSMSNRSARDTVLQQLPNRMTNAISRHDAARVDVMNILLTVTSYENGLALLLDALRFFDEGTTQMSALDTFLSKLGVK